MLDPFTGETTSRVEIDEDKIKAIIGDAAKVDILVEKIIEELEEDELVKAGAGKRKLLKKKVDAAAKALIAAQNLTAENGYEINGIKDKITEMRDSIKKVEDYINQ